MNLELFTKESIQFFLGLGMNGIMCYPDGRTFEGPYSNGSPIGTHKVTLPDGTEQAICTVPVPGFGWDYVACDEDDDDNEDEDEDDQEDQGGQDDLATQAPDTEVFNEFPNAETEAPTEVF